MNTNGFLALNGFELNLELPLGTFGGDVIIGTTKNEIIAGLEGDDSLIGKDGNDVLLGGIGNDNLVAGRGNNLLLGEEGDDVLSIDNVSFPASEKSTLDGGAGNDILIGNDSNDLLIGGTGSDIIFAGEGNDTIRGNQGVDFLFGDKGNDRVEGGKGDDSLEGGDGNDRVYGGAGADILFGGEGLDTIVGGQGADTFILRTNADKDLIRDFRDGQDKFMLESTIRFGGELTFDGLAIVQTRKGTDIIIAETGETLAFVRGVAADDITREDFVTTSSEMNSEASTMNESMMQKALNMIVEEYDTNSIEPPVLESLEMASNATDANSETGLTVSQAVEVMNADIARDRFGVDGTGITIGVISDSYDRGLNVTTTERDDVLSGDIPGIGNPSGNDLPVTILDDNADNSSARLIDEGRGMIQLIHDVAPGADFLFHSAFNGPEDFAEGIDELVAAGADIIVDDIVYFAQPFFQDGIIAQAADRSFAAGVPYFSSAGNQARSSYESEFRLVESNNQVYIPGLEDYQFHDFDPGEGVDVLQNFTLESGRSVILSVQWDNPFASAGGKGATSDLDVIILDENNNIVAFGVDSNIGFDAVELVGFTNNTGAAAEYKLLIGQYTTAGGEAPSQIKYIDFRSGTDNAEFATNGSTIFGHPNASGAQGVGAAFYQTPTQLESFSSVGITPILFDTQGNRLAEPEIRQKPDIVAPDGTNTTFFGRDVEGDGFPNFFGTSAAAPHAAAVAALMLEAYPQATPELIYNALEQTAIDMDNPFTPRFDRGFDTATGSGLIQADLAIAALPT